MCTKMCRNKQVIFQLITVVLLCFEHRSFLSNSGGLSATFSSNFVVSGFDLRASTTGDIYIYINIININIIG